MADIYQKSIVRRGEPYRPALSVPNLIHHADGYGVILLNGNSDAGNYLKVRPGQHVELDEAGNAIGLFSAAEVVERGFIKAP